MAENKKIYSSDLGIDMEREYVYHVYPGIRESGAQSPAEAVLRPLYFDELNYALGAEGTRLYLFGGPWSAGTQAAVGPINALARKHGVDAVYNFDFRADSESPDTNFKVDISAQASYDGPGKQKPVAAADFNYLYGELVTHHLKNLNDWVQGKVGSGDDITYLNLYEDAVTVPNLHEPFLFLHNRETGILGAAELEDVPAAALERVLEEKIFSLLPAHPVTPYTHADYIYDAFKRNERGHAFKTEDCFQKGEQINLHPVPFAVLRWILDREGTFAVLFAGAWCANSQGGVTTVNDYAVANGVRVYFIDPRFDGKYPIDFWKYPRSREFRLNSLPLRAKYFELWENRLAGAPLLVSLSPAHGDRPPRPITQSYVDEAGTEHTILGVDIPYLLVVNRDGKDNRGNPRPVLAGVNHEGIELLNCQKSYVYYAPNYIRYKAGIYKAFLAYADSVGTEVRDISVDRTAPLAAGEPVRHVETVAYHKEHDWYKERAGWPGGDTSEK